MTAAQLSEEAVAESVSTTNIPSNEENVNTQNSIPDNKADAEYMSAVESGDMETAQREVKNINIIGSKFIYANYTKSIYVLYNTRPVENKKRTMLLT